MGRACGDPLTSCQFSCYGSQNSDAIVTSCQNLALRPHGGHSPGTVSAWAYLPSVTLTPQNLVRDGDHAVQFVHPGGCRRVSVRQIQVLERRGRAYVQRHGRLSSIRPSLVRHAVVAGSLGRMMGPALCVPIVHTAGYVIGSCCSRGCWEGRWGLRSRNTFEWSCRSPSAHKETAGT